MDPRFSRGWLVMFVMCASASIAACGGGSGQKTGPGNGGSAGTVGAQADLGGAGTSGSSGQLGTDSGVGNACIPDAAQSDAAAGPICSFDATYVYGFVGGQQVFTDLVTLAPPGSYTVAQTPVPSDTDASASCAPPLPTCGDDNAIDVSDIMRDLADPTVQLLLSLTTTQTIMLGVRVTPDDPLFTFQKSGTVGFQLGASCWNGLANCTDIPRSVSKLETDLIALDKQQRQDPTCAGSLSSGL
jgi:hypothetical protein